MIAKANKKAFLEAKLAEDGGQQTTRDWFTRYLRRPPPTPAKEEGNMISLQVEPQITEPPRPYTAPSTDTHRTIPECPLMVERPSTRLRNKPPPRPPRPHSGVIRHVNEWLDASMIKPAPQLMGGLPYWREGDYTETGRTNNVQYAVPIIQTTEANRPSTSHSQNIKSFCRRAKKANIHMPSLLRARSSQVTSSKQKQANRQSTSMPLLTEPYGLDPTPTPRLLVRSRSLANMISQSNAVYESGQDEIRAMRGGRGTFLELPRCRDNPSTVRLGEQEPSAERRGNSILGQSIRGRDHTCPSTAAIRIPREDSIGNLSDAPTYFSGPPPPSYRSRAASVLTTSSFGCVDGMNTERRQISQQKAAQQSRGMKGTIRKLVQKAHLRK
jgi:hypothetical protein